MNSFKELYERLDVDTCVSIKIKKEQIDYCFAAESFDEFMIRYRKLIGRLLQYTFYVDTDTVQKKYRGGFIK